MNYCVLNGVRSDTVRGLLIQELPPVSKPLMRTEIQQIDGRDGDIVTKLGYSAYDKRMRIGLHGDFDIDDVIAYFDSEGTVTFSNEPGKYYVYQIIEQIDFERLLRFREADVTFHVQPYKYSAVGDDVSVSADRYGGLPDLSQTAGGVTVTAFDGSISVVGTATGRAEFYLPINHVSIGAGSYVLEIAATGTGASACAVRLIGHLPTDADTFGGSSVYLQDDATAIKADTLTAPKEYGYLWISVASGAEIDITFDVALIDEGVTSMTLINLGNTASRPIIDLRGSGTIGLSINGVSVITLTLGSMEDITIDAAAMNAYRGDVLMNRSVTGDYSDVTLRPGTNTLSWSGEVHSVEVTKISRWI